MLTLFVFLSKIFSPALATEPVGGRGGSRAGARTWREREENVRMDSGIL